MTILWIQRVQHVATDANEHEDRDNPYDIVIIFMMICLEYSWWSNYSWYSWWWWWWSSVVLSQGGRVRIASDSSSRSLLLIMIVTMITYLITLNLMNEHPSHRNPNISGIVWSTSAAGASSLAHMVGLPWANCGWMVEGRNVSWKMWICCEEYDVWEVVVKYMLVIWYRFI